jgi:hypothetical protein
MEERGSKGFSDILRGKEIKKDKKERRKMIKTDSRTNKTTDE